MIRFSNHVRQRMKERDIKVLDVRSAILNPDYEGRSFDDKIVVRKSLGRKILEVVYVKERRIILVITAYFL